MRTLYLLLMIICITGLSCKEDEGVTNPVIDNSPRLLIYLPFNGNANDESGNDNHATNIQATLTTDRFGNSNSAYYFNGIDNYIYVPNSLTLRTPKNSISMCAWVYVNNWYNNNWSPIFVKANSGYGMYGMQLLNFSDAKLLEVHLNDYYINSNYTFSLNQWYFIVFTWDGGTAKYYANGYLIEQKTLTGTITADNEPLIIGQDPPEINEYLKGKLDEIRIYDKAIPASTVDSIYALNH